MHHCQMIKLYSLMHSMVLCLVVTMDCSNKIILICYAISGYYNKLQKHPMHFLPHFNMTFLLHSVAPLIAPLAYTMQLIPSLIVSLPFIGRIRGICGENFNGKKKKRGGRDARLAEVGYYWSYWFRSCCAFLIAKFVLMMDITKFVAMDNG